LYADEYTPAIVPFLRCAVGALAGGGAATTAAARASATEKIDLIVNGHEDGYEQSRQHGLLLRCFYNCVMGMGVLGIA
jgi:hypothetical protein